MTNKNEKKSTPKMKLFTAWLLGLLAFTACSFIWIGDGEGRILFVETYALRGCWIFATIYLSIQQAKE